MLGDDKLAGPGGFLLLDEKFEIAGRWEADLAGMNYNYDFWYQPRHNVMVSSEWAAPATTRPGFKLDDVFPADYIRASVEKSLENLGTSSIDLLQFHVWEDDWANDERWQRVLPGHHHGFERVAASDCRGRKRR